MNKNYKIRRLERNDCAKFSTLMSFAYPGFAPKLAEKIFNFRMESGDAYIYGLFDGGDLLGSYRRHNFEMCFRGAKIKVAGLGGVAVDMRQKKKHICLEMIKEFHRQSVEDGYRLAALYPFRVEFYRKMGYGVVTRVRKFVFNSTDLPQGDAGACEFVESEAEYLEYYNKKAAEINGMIFRDATPFKLMRELGRPPKNRVGVRRNGRLTACMEFAFADFGKSSPFSYSIEVKETLYDAPEDLRALLAFLRAQSDQTKKIAVYSFDPDFWLSALDISSPEPGTALLDEFHIGETVGYGLMTRVLDAAGMREILASLKFNETSVEAVFVVEDDLIAANDMEFAVKIADGRFIDEPACASAPRIKISVEDFSIFLMGGTTLSSLARHSRRVACADAKLLRALDAAFALDRPPECWNVF